MRWFLEGGIHGVRGGLEMHERFRSFVREEFRVGRWERRGVRHAAVSH